MESLLQLLRYLDTHPHLYHSTCWLAYCGFAAYLVLFCSDRLQRHRWLASDVFFAAILGIVLLIFRWPGLFYNGELNPDESFEIVAARRLLQHPVFGTGVDGGTAGPLNFYLLCILPLVGLKIDYLSARLVGLVIVWMAVFVQYRTVSLFADRRVARLSIAPLATFFAFSTFWDFVHLSTEHLSLLLFSLGAFLLASAVSRPDRDPKLEVFGLGLVAGMLPMAKLQSILLSIALLICAVVWILRKSRQNSLISPKALLTGLVLGAMCVPVGFVLFTTLTGGFAEFFRTFILMNMFYSTEIKEIPSLALLMNFVVFGSQGPGFLAFLLGGLGFAAYSFGVAPAGRKTTLLFGTTLFWCVVALVTAILPGRPSGHYLLYVVIAIGLLVAVAFATIWTLGDDGESPPQRHIRNQVLLFFGLACLAPQIASRIYHPNPLRGAMTGTQKLAPGPFPMNPEQNRHPVTQAIASLVRKGDSIAVWGFMPRFYVESNTKLGIRYAVSDWQILDNPLRDHFRAEYLSDFKTGNVVFFVDAVAPGSIRFTNRGTQGYEIFPKLAEYISKEYTFYGDANGIRLYLHNDRYRELSSQH